MSRYQKKHSPTHHPNHHPIFISFFHLLRSIASSLCKLRARQSFSQPLSTSFLVYPLIWSPPPHIPYISSPNQFAPFPQIDIIGDVMIVWREGGKLSGLFCAILCATIVHTVMHTHMNRLTVLWIGFCLTGPISLCLDSFLHVLCVLLYTVCMFRFVTR